MAQPSAKQSDGDRRLRVTLVAGLALALAIGGRYAWNAHASRAPEATANAFVHDLFSGEARRAFDGTSRRFRARNDAASFEAEFSRRHASVEVGFEQRNLRGDRAELRGRVKVGDSAIPITVTLIREDGVFRVDDFHLDP